MPRELQPERSDERLVRLAQKGDTAAFESLYRSNLQRIYALAMRMLRNPSAAEEATQEVFVRAWERLRSFRRDSLFSSWLHRMTVNLILDQLRARQRFDERFVEEPEAADLKPARQPRHPPAAARLDLEAAVALLPEQARMVFLLHDVEGYRHREIAGLLEIAEGTSKAHLHRARRQLRKDLAR